MKRAVNRAVRPEDTPTKNSWTSSKRTSPCVTYSTHSHLQRWRDGGQAWKTGVCRHLQLQRSRERGKRLYQTPASTAANLNLTPNTFPPMCAFPKTASWESPGLKESSFGRSTGGIWTPAKVNISQSGAAAGQSYLMQLCLIRKVLQHLTQTFYSARSRRIFFQAEWSSWKQNVELLRFHEWKPWLIFHIKRVAAKITVTLPSIEAPRWKITIRDEESLSETGVSGLSVTKTCLGHIHTHPKIKKKIIIFFF